MTVVERFLNYVNIDTRSDENSESCPSTPGQLIFADMLVSELKAIGLNDAVRDADGYVYAHIEASPGCEAEKSIGFIAHMDTSPDACGTGIKPRIITYDGENAKFIPAKYIGSELIVTDGTTLLGADDKAGVAEIVSACERIVDDPSIKHGRICVGFTPDEEIGRGADRFDLERFGADFAYTADGGDVCELEDETFNAASVKLNVHGVNTHPGSAKGIMKNASLYLCEFISMLPPEQTPAHTCGREGFYHVTDICGNETEASLGMLIRDHDREKFEQRKAFVEKTAAFLNEKYGEGIFELKISDSYYNMKEVLSEHSYTVDRALAAMKACGIDSVTVPIRGGTDGARLSFMGLPCPNLPAGGFNFHGVYEAIPVCSLEKIRDIIVEIAKC